MIPVYYACKKLQLPVLLVSTGQHTDLLQEVFKTFSLEPDIDLALGKPNQDLSYLTQAVLGGCKKLYEEYNPAAVVLQGDTTTVMAAALAAFYQKIPVVHIEAGLRTHDIGQPYPEELNRRVLSLIAEYHCAPTSLSVGNLLAENIHYSKIVCTGNTVVDALRIIRERIETQQITVRPDLFERVKAEKLLGKKIILLTTHRRESFEGGIQSIFATVKELIAENKNLFFVYPAHPNPVVQQAIAQAQLVNLENFLLLEPLAYKDLVYVLSSADVVMTDSGGIQEEAISLGKPTLILRDKTERIEGVWDGIATVVGTHGEKIKKAFAHSASHARAHKENSIYGDGYAAERIAQLIQKYDTGAPAVFDKKIVMDAKEL